MAIIRAKKSATEAFRNMVQQRTGLEFKPDDDVLQKCLNTRLTVNKISDYSNFQRLLERESVTEGPEWRALLTTLTIGESYFFRDRGQFHLLRYRLLPELIERKKRTKVLRVWSAGCSSGEEAYSLAILLETLLPESLGWHFEILATDICEQRLDAARQGIYSEWSLRDLSQDMQRRFFDACQDGYYIKDNIRRRVSFRLLNLLHDNEPQYDGWGCGDELGTFDLIVCRNVFIYFSDSAIEKTLARFSQTLAAGGYLITGHAEIFGHHHSQLISQVFPESVVYQKADMPVCKISDPVPGRQLERAPLTDPPYTQSRVEQIQGTNSEDSLPEQNLAYAKYLFSLGEYQKLIDLLKPEIVHSGNPIDVRVLVASSLNNLGQYSEAETFLEAALKQYPLCHWFYYLLAHAKELQGHESSAIDLLQKVIYLAEDYIPAYLDLAAILERQGRQKRAHALRLSVIKQLSQYPPEQIITPYLNITAGELQVYLKNIIGNTE